MIVLANNFLAGSLITLLIPGLVFIAIAVWFTYSVWRVSAEPREDTPDVPGPRQPPSAGLTGPGESPRSTP